jgi:dihydrolipoamide dehydrogenase
MTRKIVIIGGGPGGYVASIRAAQLGARVTVVERETLGGTCLNWGCVPTKTLLHSARLYRAIQGTRRFGVYAGEGSFRFDKMVENKNAVVQISVSGVENLLRKHGVELVRGTGELLDASTVLVRTNGGDGVKKTADAIVIATGSEPLVPGFVQLDNDRIITTNEAVYLDHLPASIAVVGGSVSGCEFACLFGLLGAEVTLIEMLPQIAPTEDAEISRRLEGALRNRGIQVKTNTAWKAVEKNYPSGSVTLTTEPGDRITADYCLVAVGRKLNTEGIGLERLGVDFSTKGIAVNDRMETNIQGVYAIGDVTGKMLLAHVASEQGIAAVENIMGLDSTMDYSAVPSFIYTDPEIGSVGMKEQEAKVMGMDVMRGKAMFKTNAMAHAVGDTTGFVKTLLDRDTGRVLGVHILGPHATDLLAEAVTMVKTRMTLEEVKKVVHPHPTLSETIKEAVLASVDQAIHG